MINMFRGLNGDAYLPQICALILCPAKEKENKNTTAKSKQKGMTCNQRLDWQLHDNSEIGLTIVLPSEIKTLNWLL